MAISVNANPSPSTSTYSTTFTPTKVFYHGDNISKGYYYGEGFKLINNEWVLMEKEGMVYLVFRPVKPSKPQNYIILLSVFPLKSSKRVW